MGAEARANIAVTIGDVNLGPGATAILGMNKVGSDFETQEKTIQRCKNELFVSEPRSVRAELINTKGSLTEGTCRWIRHNEIYRSWLDAQESGLLWISGRPGRGKTMLSIFLTREWESLPDHVLYVFCGDKSTSDEVTIMRSLLYQVLDQAPSMVNHVEDCLGTEERTKRTLSSRGDLWAMFTSMLKDPKLGPVLGLIDGLDECQRDSTRWLLNNLRQVFDKGSRSTLSPRNPFKLAIVSRDMVGLRSFPQLNLETKTDAIARDVYRVIDAKMKEHDLFSELDDGFIKEVKRALWGRSDGTFLWVGFAIQELLSAETKIEMRLVLDAIPRDLGALYSKILLWIKGPMRGKVAQLLHWVALTCHPLALSDLTYALGLDVQTILDLAAMSGSLLTLSEQDTSEMIYWYLPGLGYSLKLDGRTVVVVKLVPRVEAFRIHVEEMEFQITQRCLRAVEAEIILDTILHWAIDRARPELVELLLQNGADVDVRAVGFSPRTPLRAAILNRSVDMVRLLLEHGADPNWEFPESKIPPDLQWVDVKTGLLEWTGTPLDWNKAVGDEQWVRIAKLLVQRGGVYNQERRTNYPDSDMLT